MNFLVDNQLPPALARLIQTEFGLPARHVSEVGLRDASDFEVWQFASISEAIVISKDEDFAGLIQQKPTAKLIWVRVGNCRRMFLLNLFRRTWPRIIERLESGDGFTEVR